MMRILRNASLCLLLASGAALAQGTGSGSGSTGGNNDANTNTNQQNPVRPNSNLPPAGTSGITTQSTTPPISRPTEAQCRQGWAADMPWTRAEFEAACR